jgi:hypothetical protein
MSGHGDPHDEALGNEHGHDEHERDDDHHAPPALEEPATPLWLTLLGLGLFLLAGILFIATREDGKTTAQLTAVPAGEAAPSAAAAAPPAAPPTPTPTPMPTPMPNPAAAPNPGNPAVRLNAPPHPPGGPSGPTGLGGIAQPAVRPRPAP